MKTKTFDMPALYGDHHVIEVRRILLALPGVQAVNASSAFRCVEVQYDETQTNDLEIALKLDEAGYLNEWSVPFEAGEAAYHNETNETYFRHTAVYETTRQVVSFAQQVKVENSRPLWNCPGFGLMKNKMED